MFLFAYFYSSIGMAKAALEALNGFNLFGREGASWSVLYADPDAHGRNRTILESLLPRESSSKVSNAVEVSYCFAQCEKMFCFAFQSKPPTSFTL